MCADWHDWIVNRYVDSAEFDRWKEVAEDMGILYVASGPLVPRRASTSSRTTAEGESNTGACVFHRVLAISHTMIIYLHSLAACNIFCRQNTI